MADTGARCGHPRKRHAVDPANCVSCTCPAYVAPTDDTAPTIDRDAIRARHRRILDTAGDFCSCGGDDYPCATLRLLDALDAETRRGDAAEASRDDYIASVASLESDVEERATERDEARRQVEAVRALHRPITTHDECPHDDPDACDAWETTDGLIVCGPSLGSVCDECRDEDGDRYVYHPCATLRALGDES